ncbi:MAG TPA: alpha-1,4-glucan--maltose-1-phosphate maltosyltransferase, partial [Stellaceae bacterium]|nr:alpha-1,4-glucan--maltose-1-phosphate maltosyltransferase [Stellaceae bacterium]
MRQAVQAAAANDLTLIVDLVVAPATDPAIIAADPDGFAHFCHSRLMTVLGYGVTAFCCPNASMFPAIFWRRLTAAVRETETSTLFFADTLGRPNEETLGLVGAGFDFVFNSICWWDGYERWFVDQHRVLQRVAPSIGFPALGGVSNGTGGVADAERRRARYLLAAGMSSGVLMPTGYEDGSAGLDADIAAINDAIAEVPAVDEDGPILPLDLTEDMVRGYARWSPDRRDVVFVLINGDTVEDHAVDLDLLLSAADDTIDLEDLSPGADAVLLPGLKVRAGEIRLIRGHVLTEAAAAPGSDAENPLPPRVVIEQPSPVLDDAMPIKRVVGDRLDVSADIFRDGHDKLAAAIRLTEPQGQTNRLVAMRHVDNDRWSGTVTLSSVGRARIAIEAWTDRFGSWASGAAKKRAAGQDVRVDLEEGRALLQEASARAGDGGPDRCQHRLGAILEQYDALADDEARADLLLSRFTLHAVAAVPLRDDRVAYKSPSEVVVDRERARFAAWYEMFPRSQGTMPGRPATFDDCIRRLPEIRDLGFHVVYVVPIHPIGTTHRKGRHNSLQAGPGDPGSPYAIGSPAGGHDAIDPELGTLEDFRRFSRAVADHGMELALDFAVQCSPDHPWLREHPEWFRWRKDGTVRYAENPPKKYEDIVNVDFDCRDWRSLWAALRDVVLFWHREGVKIFRVDNPHTKPLPFWAWLIDEVKSRDPDVLFLSEAFTRPKMMQRLAKIGFSQSYSYFTWRNTKDEITEYLRELTAGPASEYYRPNFFTNTPDILPFFLQTGGRAGFRIRLVLAAMLSPLYGIYNGFELCEADGIPGREEYYDSEKYRYKVWDWDRPGNIKDDVRRLNRLREQSPALKLFTNLRFHHASHPEVLFFSKAAERDEVYVVVSLNPHQPVETDLVFPPDLVGPDGSDRFATEELFSGEQRQWQGRYHRIVIGPAHQ